MKRPKKQQINLPSQISGMVGVYLVAYELSRMGYVALPTNRNLQGIDLVVTNQEGTKHAAIQVKTMQSKSERWQVKRGQVLRLAF